jgi:hypothetical protein
MKKLSFQILFTALIIFGLNGCYTIIWSPDTEFPNQDNSDNSTIYYGDTYYGPYFIYYDTPWWYDYTPPKPVAKTREDNSEINRLRDSDGGRGNPGRVPEVQPPSRNENPSGNNNTNGSSDNSGNKSTETSVRNSSSTSSSGNTSGRSNTSGSGSVRDNNGGRSSGGRR